MIKLTYLLDESNLCFLLLEVPGHDIVFLSFSFQSDNLDGEIFEIGTTVDFNLNR